MVKKVEKVEIVGTQLLKKTAEWFVFGIKVYKQEKEIKGIQHPANLESPFEKIKL